MRHRVRLPAAFGLLTLGITVALAGLVVPAGRDDGGRHVIRKGPRPDGPAEYVEWRNFSLRDENGQLSANGLMQAKAHVDLMRQQTAPSPGAGISPGSWTAIGPGNIGGRVRALVIHPTSTDTMFAGSVSGGIWKTTNGGGSWAPVDDFMANLAVSSIVMIPGTPSTMFAATGEGFYNIDGIRGAGIFRSYDGGTVWTQLPSTSTLPGAGQSATDYHYVNEIAVSPAGTTLLAATGTGIFRSTDNGDSFARATMVGGAAVAVGNGIVDVDFHPTDSTRAVAATFAGTALYSTDGGATWTLAGGMPGGSTFRRSELAYAPTNGSVVYASVDLDSGSIYKSTDGGQSYVEIFDGAADMTINPLGGQGWYDNLLWVSPTDETLLMWGGIDLWRSATGGTAFVKASQWFSQSYSGPTSAHADQHIAVAHPGYNGTSNRIVFFGNDGGVYHAADVTTVGSGPSYQGGWTELNNNLAITQFYGGAGNASTGRITGGTQDNGTLFYSPAFSTPSENWINPFGGDGGFSAYDTDDPNYFYGEYVYLQLHRNTSGGATGSAYIDANLPDAGSSTFSEFIAAFILDPNENNRLLGASVRLWRTNDVKATMPAFEEIKSAVGGKISAIAVAAGNSNLIYAGHADGHLYKTTNGTAAAATVRASWTTIDNNGASNPLPNRRITRVTIDPANNDIVYVTLGGFSGDNIYKSGNGGVSWTDITGPAGGATALPSAPVRDLDVHPTNSNWLYAGTEVGIFTSQDGGATWTLPQDGPANVSVDELFFMGTTLVAVTHGRGMFSTPTTGGGAPPTAVDDSYGTSLNTTLTVTAPGVLGNDNSNGGGTMTTLLVSNVTQGSLALAADGGFVYTPAAGYTGADSFTYRAVNSAGNSNVATVNISITAGLPTAVDDNYVTTINTFLSVAPPGVLANDSSNGGGALTAQLVAPPANGVLTLDADGRVGYQPATGFTGADSFTYRASNSVGLSNVATVTITVNAVPSAEPPTGLYASSIVGNIVTLRWTPPASGLTPTDYTLEGGLNPGEVLAIISTGTSPIFTFVAPSGAFYVRIHTISGANKSIASNEIQIFVNVPASPSAPANLLGLVDGSNLALAWRNTFGGGAPTGLLLDVSGSVAATLPLPLGDSFSFAGVPAGTYTLSVRATNAAGTSGPSNPVTLTFPGGCSGAPLTPANFLATRSGNLITVLWDPATSGPAPTGFVLNVTGSFVGAFPTTLRSLAGIVGPGSYTLSVYATNACGSSAATTPQTVVVP